MKTVLASPPLLDDAIMNHHDYVWARLPFVVQMAIAAARRRGDATAHELARLVRVLRPLLLDHLDREEAMLVDRSAASVTARIREGMHAEHLAVSAVIDQIRVAAGRDYQARDGAEPTERALYLELAQLDAHVRTQIVIEERLMAWGQRAIRAGS
jgi:iron-sulfur cluster repair protein YtfE (RIC family)